MKYMFICFSLMISLLGSACSGSSSEECQSSRDCEEGLYCNLETHKCEEEECQPVCTNLCCGSDGCEGICPDECPSGTICNETLCMCRPECESRTCAEMGKDCGQWDDGCGTELTCGSCGHLEYCSVSGRCECEHEECNVGCCEEGESCYLGSCCTPECTGKCCGSDGCGNACPDTCSYYGLVCEEATCLCVQEYECTSSADCPPGYFCDLTVHECKEETCIPECHSKCCGQDGCGGVCPNTCPPGTNCNVTTCMCDPVCQPNCAGRICGPDDCGGLCPPGCAANETCSADGTECILECTPNCAGRVCGPDGCGDACPPGCGAGYACVDGQCEITQPHQGAGDYCHCDEGAQDCSTPCPTAAGSAHICLITNIPSAGDGFCTFECTSTDADAECQVDFTDGCCEATGTAGTFVCYQSEYCPGPGEQGYKEPCGGEFGNCQSELLCLGGFGAGSDEAYCVYPCDFPGGSCLDGGACAPTSTSGEGWCQPPGPNGISEFCDLPLNACASGLMCMSFSGAGAYCGASCSCTDGSGCPSSPYDIVCAWGFQDDQGNWVACYCGYQCTTASDCPNGGTGWTCNSSNNLCLPQ